jgi:hypothetical protein
MTELEVRREIFYTITECKDHNVEPLVSHIDTAQTIATSVLFALKGKGVLNVDPNDDD